MVAGERAGDVDGLVAVAAEERPVLDAEDEGRLLLADVAAREAAGTGGRVSAFGTCGRVLCRRAKTASWVDAWRPRPSGGGGRVLAAQPSPRLSASEAASWRRRRPRLGSTASPARRVEATSWRRRRRWRRRPGGGGGHDLAQPHPGSARGGRVLAAVEARPARLATVEAGSSATSRSVQESRRGFSVTENSFSRGVVGVGPSERGGRMSLEFDPSVSGPWM